MNSAAVELNFSWVEPDRLAGARGPHSDSDLSKLRSLGIGALVRLAEETDVTPQQVQRAGLEDWHEPITDLTPPTQDQIDRVLGFISDQLRRGNPVAVSCYAGRGRTGSILGCYLVARGRSAADAIQHLIKIRPESDEILKVPGQKDAIYKFERRFNAGEVTL